MTTIDMIARVSTTTPTNASVSRACRLRGTMRAGTMRRSSPLSPEVGARPPVILAGTGIRAGASPASPASTASKVSTGSAGGSLSPSALGEGVADSPHGQDEGGRGGIVLDLLAKVADVDVDRLLVLVERLVVAEELEELGPRVDPAGPAREMAEDLELRRREADPAGSALHAPALEVDEEIAVADDAAAGGIGEVAVGASQERLDAAHELAKAERLRHVVVCAELEADDLVDLVVARRQHEHGCLRPSGAQPAQDLEPVDAGQPDVEDDEVGRLVDREVEPVLARPGDGYLVALLLERVLDPAGNRELVFDDEDGGGHRWRDATPKVPHGRSAGSIGVDRRARSAPCD